MTTISLRIACVQANPTVGDIRGNFDIVRRWREKLGPGADLLVFSEMFATGYPVQDLVLRPDFRSDFRTGLDALAAEMKGNGGPAVLVGGPLEGAALPYNAMFLVDTDGSIRTVLKHKLANDEVYDEVRTFAPGPKPAPVEFRGFKLGIIICEDLWHTDVPRALADEGADIILVPNGSHFRSGKQQVRLSLAKRTVRALGLPVAYVNQVGGQDELVFDGGSFAVDTSGNVLHQVGFREASFGLILERDEEGRADLVRGVDGWLSGESGGYPEETEALYSAMVMGLRDYVNKNGFKGVVLGLSGGADSGLSAAVAVDALGADRVLVVRMPSPYTSDDSMTDAAEQAALLGVRMETVSIEPAMQAFRTMLAPLFDGLPEDVTEENIQARARGMTLMAISNKFGHMVLSTGNKSETSVGYATLYGDMCGGFNVLKDVYKTQVFKLGHWRNANRRSDFLGPEGRVIPERVLTKAPSAELKPGQTDESALGSYEDLDAVLVAMVEGMNGPEMAVGLILRNQLRVIDADYARRIAGLVHRAEYKRRQGCPGVVLTTRGYDKGWRLPITNKYGL